MGIIVSKFGGSSIADAKGFRRVREIILAQKRRRYIVLSAPGRRSAVDQKMTDLLLQANQLYAEGKSAAEPLSIIRERFASIIDDLHLEIDPESFLSGLEYDIQRSPAFASSRGEYLCAKLFSIYSGIPFVDSAELILFDKNGRIQRDEIKRAVCAMKKRIPYAIIPGFYGSMPDKSIHTFTRGGSDITGALIAAALNADAYENWTDVDGLMSIDPRLCAEAVCHYAVSYRQMRRLAKAGAEVLHPYCVEPVCEAGIPTLLRNTFSPEKPGTYISDCVRGNVPCVCEQKGFYAVRADSLSDEEKRIAEGLGCDIYTGFGGEKFIALQAAANAKEIPVSIVSVFGLPCDMQKEIARYVQPVAMLCSEHCSRFLIKTGNSSETQRKLHNQIMKDFKASRNPSDCGG